MLWEYLLLCSLLSSFILEAQWVSLSLSLSLSRIAIAIVIQAVKMVLGRGFGWESYVDFLFKLWHLL